MAALGTRDHNLFYGKRKRNSKPISLTSIEFYPIKVSVYMDKTETECPECDFKIDMNTLIITTFNEIESLENYHLFCYTKSPNHIQFDWPDCSARIHNLNRLTADQQLVVKQILLPKISSHKSQLRQEISLENLSKQSTSLMDELQAALKKRDIEVYEQEWDFDEPQWDLQQAIKKYKHYFDDSTYQKKKEHLLTWYFKSTSITTNFPKYLMKIVMRYCAEFDEKY